MNPSVGVSPAAASDSAGATSSVFWSIRRPTTIGVPARIVLAMAARKAAVSIERESQVVGPKYLSSTITDGAADWIVWSNLAINRRWLQMLRSVTESGSTPGRMSTIAVYLAQP